MEAYASGVPVSSTNVGYVKTVAGPKCRSLNIESLSPGEFIKKINQLKKDRVLVNELKKKQGDKWFPTIQLIKQLAIG